MSMLVGFGGLKESGKDAAASAIEKAYGARCESVSYSIDLAVREVDPVITVSNGGRPIHYAEYVDVVCRGDFDRAKTHPEVRRVLQRIGSLGRSIDGDVWLERAKSRMLVGLEEAGAFAMTGLRFPGEIGMVSRAGGLTIWVSRPGHEDTSSTEVTETSVGPGDFDTVIVNDGTLAELHAKTLEVVRAWAEDAS